MAASARSPVSALVKSPVSPSRTTSSTPEARTATAGRPERVRLRQDEPLRLRLRGEHEQVRRLVERRQRLAAHAAVEVDPRGRRARLGLPAEARLVGALPHEQQAAAGHGRGDGAERVDHPPHALLAVEPPHVETDRVIRGQPEHPAGLTLVAGREEIERHAGRDDGDRRPDPAQGQRGRHVLGWGDHQVRGAREPAGEANRQPRHRPLRQRHVVGVLLVARVVREDERPSEPPRQPPRRDAEQERVLGMHDVEGESAREPGEPGRDRQRQREPGIRRSGNGRVAEDAGGIG